MLYHADTAIIVGGSQVDIALLRHWSDQLSADIFAADSGVGHCLAAGIGCRAVFGDMDSVSAGIRSQLSDDTGWHAIAEQDTTDLEKLLMHLDAPVILGFGFMDGRFDHALQVMTVMARYCSSQHIVMVGAEDCMMICDGDLSIQTQPDSRVSIWPLAEMGGMSSTGLVWPLDGLTLSPDGQTATSNRTSGTVLTIRKTDAGSAPYAVIMSQDMTYRMLAASRQNAQTI